MLWFEFCALLFEKPDYISISANFATYLQPIPLHATVESTSHCSKTKLDPGDIPSLSQTLCEHKAYLRMEYCLLAPCSIYDLEKQK